MGYMSMTCTHPAQNPHPNIWVWVLLTDFEVQGSYCSSFLSIYYILYTRCLKHALLPSPLLLRALSPSPSHAHSPLPLRTPLLSLHMHLLTSKNASTCEGVEGVHVRLSAASHAFEGHAMTLTVSIWLHAFGGRTRGCQRHRSCAFEGIDSAHSRGHVIRALRASTSHIWGARVRVSIAVMARIWGGHVRASTVSIAHIWGAHLRVSTAHVWCLHSWHSSRAARPARSPNPRNRSRRWRWKWGRGRRPYADRNERQGAWSRVGHRGPTGCHWCTRCRHIRGWCVGQA